MMFLWEVKAGSWESGEIWQKGTAPLGSKLRVGPGQTCVEHKGSCFWEPEPWCQHWVHSGHILPGSGMTGVLVRHLR